MERNSFNIEYETERKKSSDYDMCVFYITIFRGGTRKEQIETNDSEQNSQRASYSPIMLNLYIAQPIFHLVLYVCTCDDKNEDIKRSLSIFCASICKR